MPLLATRLLNLQKEMKRKSLQLSCLKAKISQNCEASGVMVDEGLHSDLKAVATYQILLKLNRNYSFFNIF